MTLFPKILYGKAGDGCAIPLVVEGIGHLCNTGGLIGSTGLPVRNDHEIFYAEVEGEVVGVLAFHRIENRTYEVVLSYVEPSSRQLGVFGKLWQALTRRAQEEGIRRIVTIIHSSNEVAHDVMEALSSELIAYVYNFTVPSKEGRS